MANDVRARASLQDELSGPLTRIGDAWNKQAKSFATGALAASAVQKGFSLVGRAVGAVTDLVGDATTAFMEDERSQRLLNVSLGENVAAWRGNTDAIEKVLDARIALGFSDDEQRESLTKLVAITKDETKALEIQRTAMDLARMRGMDLATATELLGKVAGGNVSILRRYGISIEKGASSTEALAAIQRMAAGQAEEYADTLEGRVVVSAVKSAEAVEKLGERTAELSADFEEAKAGAFENFATGLDTVADAMNIGSQSLERQIELQKVAISIVPLLSQEQKDAAFAALDLALANDKANRALDGSRASVADLSGATRRSLGPTSSLRSILDDMGYEADDTKGAIAGLATTITEELFGEAINKGNLAQLRDTHKELVKQRDAAKEGSREYKILTGEIAENEQAQFELQLQMAETEGPTALLDFLNRAQTKYGTNNTRIQTMIDKLRALYGLLVRYDDLGVITFGPYEGKTIPGYHTGGRPTPGEPAIVGEKGPELFVPDTAGTIVPSGSWGGGGSYGGGMSGSPVSLSIELDGAVLARIVDRRLRYASARSASLPD